MNRFKPPIQVEDDSLFTPEVREWSLEKYKLVGAYCDIFTTGMRRKWNQLVYLDLFAGAGYSKIIETGKIYKNSALLAMSVPNPFSTYILCEQDDDRFYSLEKRVKRDFKNLNVRLFHGDSNNNIQEIIKAIPPFRKDNTLLSFCFVDPFSLNLKFSTISALGKNLVDFLILHALHMDANRNFDNYIKEESTKIADYLGLPSWREKFDKEKKSNRKDFVKFLAYSYQDQMKTLGYQETMYMHQIRSNDKNLPLYYLGFYSKNKKGEDFFKEIQKRASSQLAFGF